MATSSMIVQAVHKAEMRVESHCPGWPHFDRHGNCLCFCGRCLGPGGCRCGPCSHQSHPR
jgi:hypothetical protein